MAGPRRAGPLRKDIWRQLRQKCSIIVFVFFWIKVWCMYVRGIFTSLYLASNSEVGISNQITFNLIEDIFQHVNVATGGGLWTRSSHRPQLHRTTLSDCKAEACFQKWNCCLVNFFCGGILWSYRGAFGGSRVHPQPSSARWLFLSPGLVQSTAILLIKPSQNSDASA